MNINDRDVAKGFLAGSVLGIVSGAIGMRFFLAGKMAEEVAFKIETIENSYEAAIALRDARDRIVGQVTDVRETEEGLEVDFNMDQPLPLNEDVPDYVGSIINREGEDTNAYSAAVEAVEEPVQHFVDGGVDDYGVSYIEEEDFMDEDGREKSRVDIIMNGNEPMFTDEDGDIDDWEEKLGNSILVDFYRLVPPESIDQVLYVRNHRTNIDYEVVRVSP